MKAAWELGLDGELRSHLPWETKPTRPQLPSPGARVPVLLLQEKHPHIKKTRATRDKHPWPKTREDVHSAETEI